jgi:preprotein translocase subunit SecG
MQIVATITQVLFSLGLIILVLVHSGKGGGLSDMFGGGMGSAAAGSTVMEKNLDRITVVIALLFTFNTLILAFMMNS